MTDNPRRLRQSWPRLVVVAVLAPILVAAGCRGEPTQPPSPVVRAVVETDPVASHHDAADDVAIWIHPTRPEASTILGTDKRTGISIYDLQGREVWFASVGKMNNVDLRQGMPWGAGLADIAAVSDKGDNAIRVYRVADEGRALELLGSQPLGEALDVDGICLYRRAADGELYAFVTDMAGPLEQWRLRPDGAGGVAFERVRAWSTGHAMEACVVDDEADRLFVSAEEHGVLVFDADPAAPTDEPLLLDAVGPGGNLSLDVEGLALYREAAGDGYLVVSSQGSDDFVVYDRQPPHALRGRFRVVHQDEDAVTHTDGIEVTSAPLGAPFERGLFVAQDDVNHDGNQNFKLVPWSSVADAVGLDPER